jgi:hypothetical protein
VLRKPSSTRSTAAGSVRALRLLALAGMLAPAPFSGDAAAAGGLSSGGGIIVAQGRAESLFGEGSGEPATAAPAPASSRPRPASRTVDELFGRVRPAARAEGAKPSPPVGSSPAAGGRAGDRLFGDAPRGAAKRAPASTGAKRESGPRPSPKRPPATAGSRPAPPPTTTTTGPFNHYPAAPAAVGAGAIAAGVADAAAPAVLAPAPDGIEIAFTEAGRAIADQARLTELVATHPFARCLAAHGIALQVEPEAVGSQRHYVFADLFAADCSRTGIEHRPDRRLAEVDLDLYPATGTGAPVTEWPPEPDLKDNANPDRFSLDPPGDAPPEPNPQRDTPAPTLSALVVRSPAVADLRLPLTFRLLGEQVSADALMLSRDCRYFIELTPSDAEAKPQRVAQKAETRSADDTRRWLIPTGKGSEAKLPPGSTARLVVEPITKAEAGECPQPLDDTPIPLASPDADGAIALPIRHPRPWLLVVATSADFPNDERLQPRQQAERRDSFWFDLLTAVANERKASNPNGFDWLFAQVVEGSAAGKAEQVLAGSQTAPEVARDKPDGVLEMSDAQAAALVWTPKTAGAVGALPVRQLEAAVLNFAGGNYPTLPGRYHTVLWVQGDGTFAAERACTQFGALAESFAKKQVRLLAYRPVRKVSDTGWTDAADAPIAIEAASATAAALEPTEPTRLHQALEPYADRAGFDGVSVCNRARFGGGTGSELIVFADGGSAHMPAAEQPPLRALADALRRARDDLPQLPGATASGTSGAGR